MRQMLQQRRGRRLVSFLVLGLLASLAIGLFNRRSVRAASAGPPFVEFESGQVRPVAMSPDGNTLFAVNTPNGTLEVFSLASGLPVFEFRVPVGLEPVAVAARTNTEVWVTNQLSDSVSIVSLTGTPHVVRTLLVGDEPRDIVFAGNPVRAFITTAHRGQQRTDPSIASVPGRGRSANDHAGHSARGRVGVRSGESGNHAGRNAARAS